MDVVDMVLGGKMNKYIVRLFCRGGDSMPSGISGADGSTIYRRQAVAEGSTDGTGYDG